ncbi:Uma2 family endonuclease [Pseudanabaena sp. FACHB-2040]|uniref:Uma2 family endonuclease n=1 Tax=Pseudanabaena sp. FACHB-2040 TaxID=2692859 RepID=UPI0032202CF6
MSAAIDTGSKKQVYHRSRVLEYVIWQSYENRLEWFCLTNGEYQPLFPSSDGIIRSQVFLGLWLPVEALLSNQMPQVLEVLQQGLSSPEHAAFTQQLKQGN